MHLFLRVLRLCLTALAAPFAVIRMQGRRNRNTQSAATSGIKLEKRGNLASHFSVDAIKTI